MPAPQPTIFLLFLVAAMPVCLAAGSAEQTGSATTATSPTDTNEGDPLAQAEGFLRAAREGRLDSELAKQAARLLDDDDPFVCGIAEWAVATKVNGENDGQEAVWPGDNPPAWFVRWSSLDGDFLLQSDYVRQAYVWSIHRDRTRLLASADKILRRAHGAAAEVESRGASADLLAAVAGRLKRLKQIRDQLADRVQSDSTEIAECRRLWLEARLTARPIVLANPSIDFDSIVFVKRHPASFANITGSQYPWGHKPGGDICVQTGLHPGGRLHNLIGDQLGPGHVHGMDLWWDADRVVFGYARQPNWPPPWDTISGDNVFVLRSDQEPTHICEIRLDGSGLRQITNHPYWSDFEPTYLPDGVVVFASDRSGRSSECGKFSADHTVINIYAADADGSNVRRLSDNKDIDRYPHTLNNGLVGYTRWEYQERHFFEVHAVWSARPDGTMADALFNQHMRAPFGFRDTRSIPSSPRLVSIATGHHTLAYGPVVIIDPRQGISDPDAIAIVTPDVQPQEGPMAGSPVDAGGVRDHGGVYQTPWALSERCFLASYSYSSDKRANGFAVYLIDVFGNKELLSRDLVYSCSFPMPVRRRPRPPSVSNVTAQGASTATCYVSDVTHAVDGVLPGTVKYLRISQRVGWPLDDRVGAMRYIPGNAWEKHFGFWAWAPVRVLGMVPVEKDGSAHFTVPADKSVYFQALDENFMEIRRMRSHISFQPGEVRGCVGCHETGSKSPIPCPDSPLALTRPPHAPSPPPWGSERLLGYEWLIQPILDQHCTRCHGQDEPDGGIDLSRTVADDGFYQSFRTMFGLTPESRSGGGKTASVGRRLVSISDRFSGAEVSQPYQFGSHKSPLIRVLLDDELHRHEVHLSRDQWLALVTWVDANAPYYDRFFNRRPEDGGPVRRDIAWDDIGGR